MVEGAVQEASGRANRHVGLGRCGYSDLNATPMAARSSFPGPAHIGVHQSRPEAEQAASRLERCRYSVLCKEPV